jgi:hypothetical protein
MSASSASLHPFANALADALKEILGKDAGVKVSVQQAGETAHASKPAETIPADLLAGILAGNVGVMAIEQFDNVAAANSEIVRLNIKGISLAGEYFGATQDNAKLRTQVARHKAASARSQAQAKMLAELTKRILAGESTQAERNLALETISAIEVAAAAVSIH